jgi:hypothetical protein
VSDRNVRAYVLQSKQLLVALATCVAARRRHNSAALAQERAIRLLDDVRLHRRRASLRTLAGVPLLPPLGQQEHREQPAQGMEVAGTGHVVAPAELRIATRMALETGIGLPGAR